MATEQSEIEALRRRVAELEEQLRAVQSNGHSPTQAEAVLRQSEETYRTLFKSMDQGYFLAEVRFDEADRPTDIFYLDANPAATEMVGQDFTGRYLRDIDPNYESHWYNIFGRVARTGVPERSEQYASPVKTWYDFSVFKVGKAESRCVAVIFREITGRKQAELREAFVLTLSDAIRPLRDPEAIKASASRVLGEWIQADRAYYAEVESDDWVVEGCYSHGLAPLPPERYAANTYGPRIMATLRAGGCLVFRDVRTDSEFTPEERDAHVSLNMFAAIEVPLIKDGKLVAILAVNSGEPRNWTEEDIFLVKETAERTWAAVERARSEALLRESEANVRLLTENLPQLVWSCLPDGQCDYLSRQWVAYTGVPEAEQLDLRWLDRVIYPEDRERTREHWLGAVAGHHPYDIEYRIRRADGEYRWFQTRGVPLRDSQGAIIKWFGTCTDIESLKRAQAELRQQWTTFDTALSHTPDFTFIFDLDGRFTYINRALLSFWQKSLDEAVGKTFFELGYPPELAARLQRQIQQAIDTREPVRDHTPFTGPTWETRHYEYILVPVFSAAGTVEAVAGATHDVTERQKMQQALALSQGKLLQVFEQAPVAIGVFRGRDFIVEMANPFYKSLLPGRDLVGHRLGDAVPEIGQTVWDAFNSVLDTGEPFIANEFHVPYDADCDGTLEDHWFNVAYNPLYESDGTADGIIAVLTEVTAQVVARQNLERANRELEEFAYVASHDLQEPLRMVNIYTEQLLHRFVPDEPEAREFAGFVHEGVARMQLLIKDLLEYSRTVHPEGLPNNGRADLSVSFSQALGVFQNRIEEYGAIVTTEHLPVVRGDAGQLAQVFQNLLSNALQYRRRDVIPEIHVAAQQQGSEWIISLQDNGIGFKPEYSERIFGLFKRLHKDEYPGTGLGLAICQRIVERCGGRMWAEGRPGEGATFYFALPAAEIL